MLAIENLGLGVVGSEEILLLCQIDKQFFGGYGASNDADWLEIGFDSSGDDVYFTTSSMAASGSSQRRDPTGWYHFFSTYDGSAIKIYVNNRLEFTHSFSGVRGINSNVRHFIGQTPNNSADRHFDGKISQCYFIDGQVLNPSNFAFTDGLTNTWRPKEYIGQYGTNGFELPMDGNTPIGKDQSGNGNDFTPVNFGGSVEPLKQREQFLSSAPMRQEHLRMVVFVQIRRLIQ